MNRRAFIKSSATAASVLASLNTFGHVEKKLRLGIVGTGNWGTEVLLRSAIATGKFEIVALCDVNSIALEKAAGIAVQLAGIRPKTFANHAAMYELKNLEAVVIASPTHWHALHFIDACKRGLHVFLEKPVSYDICESQAMLKAHLEAGNVVQVDFPRMKNDVNRQVKTFIESGEAGKIYQICANINHHEGHLVEKPIPGTLDYNAFCGPADPPRFMCENDSVPMWRFQHAFSRGILSDWGIHYIHNIRNIFGLDLPDNVMAMGGIVRNHTHDNPDHLNVQFNFGGLPVYWTHKTWGYKSPMPECDYGIYYYGEKATIFAGDLGWRVLSPDAPAGPSHGDIRFAPQVPGVWQQYLKMAEDLMAEFAMQVEKKSNRGITNTLEDAIKTTAAVIYADMSYTTKSPLQIDFKTMNVLNNAEANKLLKRDYRKPYQHPFN